MLMDLHQPVLRRQRRNVRQESLLGRRVDAADAAPGRGGREGLGRGKADVSYVKAASVVWSLVADHHGSGDANVGRWGRRREDGVSHALTASLALLAVVLAHVPLVEVLTVRADAWWIG